MIAAFRRLAARSRLIKAKRAYATALSNYKAADDRQDTRAMHAATAPLQAAHKALLAAERDALPRPERLPLAKPRRAL